MRPECTQPYLGISLSTCDLSYRSAVPGEIQELPITITNKSAASVLVRALRFVGPAPEPAPFICDELAAEPSDGAGMLLLPLSELSVTIRCVAPDERGAARQWLFFLVELAETNARSLRQTSFVLGATAAVYTYHPETATLLSTEAQPFFPAELRNLWTTMPIYKMAAPPPLSHADVAGEGGAITLPGAYVPTNEQPVSQNGAMRVAARNQPAVASEEAAAQLHKLVAQATRSANGMAPEAGPTSGISASELTAAVNQLALARQLLILEERQMAKDYDRMDVFSTPITRLRSRLRSNSDLFFKADVPGLQEQHPPVAIGDEVRMRLHALPQLEIGLRVVNVLDRTKLVLQPAERRER